MGQLVFQATLGGQVNLVGPNTASTFNINVPATSGNMVTTGDTGTVTATMLASTTGSGAVVLATSPTLVTPALGTPSALVGTNITGTAAGLSIGGNAATATTATNVSGGTSSVTSETVSGNLTLSGGTANGVAYLNGSKVVTTGSALTFDGTNLGVGTSSPWSQMCIGTPSGGSLGYFGVKDTVQGGDIRFGKKAGVNNNAIAGTWSNNNFEFYTNSTLQATLDSSGNLGLGVTPSAWYSPFKGIDVANAAFYGNPGNGTALVTGNIYVNAALNNVYKTSNYGLRYTLATDVGQHIWQIAPSGTAGNTATMTQAMTLDASGNLLVGQTTTGFISSNNSVAIQAPGGQILVSHANTSSGAAFAQFGYNGGAIGSITQSGTTAVLYNLTSDQRLKENIQDAAPASALIDAIQVRQYDWKSDGSHQRYGFIAQELVTVAPEAVHQPADPEAMMAVDYSKLVPMLVKEIQDLRKRLAALEAK